MTGGTTRLCCALALCVGALMLSDVARGEGEEQALFAEQAQKARAAEDGLEYEAAKAIWQELIARPDLSEAELVEANINAGRMALLLAAADETRRHFRAALERQPDAQLPEDDPPRLHELFEQVRQELQQEAQQRAEEQAAAAQAAAAAAASQPAPEPSPALPVELTPMLLGGAAAVGGGVLVLGLGGAAGLLSAQAHDQTDLEQVQVERGALYDARDGWAITANLGFLTGALLLVSGSGLVAWSLLEEQG